MQSNGRYNNHNNRMSSRDEEQRPYNNEYNGQQPRRNNDSNQGRNVEQPDTHHSRNAQYNNGSDQRTTQYNNDDHGRNYHDQQSRDDFRGNNAPTNQAAGDNNRVGKSNSFRSNNNRNRFRSSNGYDPNGFYAEEDDEDDDEQHQNGTYHDDRHGNDDGRARVEQSGGFDENQGLEQDNNREQLPHQNGPEHNTRHESASSLHISNNAEQTRLTQ
eukprot:scaffold39148_cov172-Skeletonema_dohrnii-CCMP3373.AAC.1